MREAGRIREAGADGGVGSLPAGAVVLSRVSFNDADAATGTLGLSTHYAQVGTLTASRTLTLSDTTKAAASSSVPVAFVVFDESGTATGSDTIVLSPESGTINGAASVAITVGHGAFAVYTDGTDWFAR